MRKAHLFWSWALAAGIVSMMTPVFAEEAGKNQSFSATTPASSRGTESPSLPGSASMHETDRTGTTGPSGSRSFSTKSGAIDAEARTAKPAGDYAVTSADRDLAAKIRTLLMGDPEFVGVAEDSLHITVNNGAVTLEGKATTAKTKDTITTRVEEITGVQSVENRMQVATVQESKR